MKKIILFLCAYLFLSIVIFAQLTNQSFTVNGQNGNGTLSQSPFYGIRFGDTGSGEGIASAKAAGSTNINGLDLSTNFLQRLRILNDGNIGIGPYATPSTRLSFGPFTAGDVSMRLAVCDNSTNRYGIGYHEEGTGKLFSFFVSDKTNGRFSFFDSYDVNHVRGYEFVTFKAANRNVGICMNEPTAKLHVKSLDASAIASFESNTTSNFVSKLNIVGSATSATNAKTNIDSWAWNYGTSVASNGTLYLQSLNTGNVGIGDFPSAPNQINAPQSKLHIQYGAFQVSQSGAPVSPRTARTGLAMGSVGTTNVITASDYSWIQCSSGPLLLNPLSGNSLTTQTNNYVAIGLKKEDILGTVGNGYNLLVGGKILCEELKIKLNSGATWYDHVLKPDYKLMKLDSLELFISKNSHLPDIPSEAEVKENGIMAGEMHGLLLKKVEELTLYMIDQNKNSEIQNAQNKIQTQAIADQAEQIKLLKEQNELLMQLIQKKTK